MAIQAWTGSGVLGPVDVMGPQESSRQGQGNAQDQERVMEPADMLGLVGGGPGLGGLASDM